MLLKIFRLLFAIILCAQYVAQAQEINHWETIFRQGDSCHYYIPDSDIGDDWKMLNFNDSTWDFGQSGFGYGDDDDNTILPEGTQCIYLRYKFNVVSKADIEAMYFDIDYDDGFLAYLNGVEIARANVKDPISWNMELNNDREASMYSGISPDRFDISNAISSLLVEGTNILSVEVHNQKASSSDMSAIAFLHAGLATTDSIYGPVPDWFTRSDNFTEFNLPLMVINTNGQEIMDEDRIVADMGIIYNGEGVLNYSGDTWNEYSGKISIEKRGETSSGFAKKSYSIELQNADGSNNNVSVLGLPEENDFVLYGPFSDKTMIKNVLTYELFRRTGRWAPRTRYVEIMMNGAYNGVYVLTEKIKRDKNRVAIDKITSEDQTPEEISGGYILRRDKKDGENASEWWTSPVEQPFHERIWYQYFDPKYSDLSFSQSAYIRNWMKEFDETISGESFRDPQNGYRKYIRTKSFIDFMFINEISKGIDNYLFSNYFYKENDNDGGQLVAGPPWDYNLSYGNLNYGDDWDAKETYGWCYPQGSRIYWYERLMEDEIYRDKVYCRWSEHRNDIFSDESIIAIIDSCVNVLGDAVDRNYAKYPTLGKYVWPAIAPFPETYDEEVANLKSWLLERLEWIDGEWRNKGYCNYEAPFEIELEYNILPDTAPLDYVVGVINTLDIDSDKHYYSLVRGKGDDDNDKFTIVDNLVLSNTNFELEEANIFSIRIESVDDDHGSIEKAFDIYVTTTTPQLAVNDLGANSFVVYPNPTTSGIKLGGINIPHEIIQVHLVDMSGKVLSTYNGKVNEISSNIYNHTKALNKGIYMLRINAKGQRISKKFIKM